MKERIIDITPIRLSSGPSLACARCTKQIAEDKPRVKIGRYTYDESCGKIREGGAA